MRAKVIKAFPGVPDGQVYTQQFEPGDIIDGELALIAVKYGDAEQLDVPDDKPPSYAESTIKELQRIAADRSIDLGDAKKKDDIIAALELADEAARKAAETPPGQQSPAA